jgi:hypothetical protein
MSMNSKMFNIDTSNVVLTIKTMINNKNNENNGINKSNGNSAINNNKNAKNKQNKITMSRFVNVAVKPAPMFANSTS